MANTIICPHCNQEVELTQALRHQIEDTVRADTEKKLRAELEEKASLEIQDLKKSLEEKDKKVQAMRDQELALREEKRKLEDAKKDMALELQRQLDEQKKGLEEQILKQAAEDHRLKDLEKEKKISDMEKLIEDLKRKAQQGSQQTQGEVLELDLESLLEKNFPNDEIQPVGKGVRGADIRQVVKSPKGVVCGVILWEIKRTKAWSDGWVSKLKEDLRAEKANVPVIVSIATPTEAESGMGVKDGVWVVKHPLVIALATLVRKGLLDVGYQKAVSVRKGDKADILYEYVIGHEFRQQVEALAEVYADMQTQLIKERVSFERSWKAREGQIRRMIMSTANIYGSMQGLVGSSMPQVKGLEMMELESGE